MTPRLAQRWRLCCEPLIGTVCAVMLPSTQHKGVVSLWLQALPDGTLQVDANAPRQDYRQLFKARFTDETEARAFWCEQYAELFGHDWRLPE